MPHLPDLIIQTPSGLYCPAGGFHIDPTRKVEKALITHAHSDHLRPGSKHYLCSQEGLGVTRARLAKKASIQTLPYHQTIKLGDVTVSLYPAGHILGSAQILIENKQQKWVISGDYNNQDKNFKPITCDTFITESTFALPIYKWPNPKQTFKQINQWWHHNANNNFNSIIFGYSLGKSQRLIQHLNPNIGPIIVHPTVATYVDCYRQSGIDLPPTITADNTFIENQTSKYASQHTFQRTPHIQNALIIAPPSVRQTSWLKAFLPYQTAVASGWMMTQNRRYQSKTDAQFILSDHADWPGILQTIQQTQCTRVGIVHGFTQQLQDYLNQSNHLYPPAFLPSAIKTNLGQKKHPKENNSPTSTPPIVPNTPLFKQQQQQQQQQQTRSIANLLKPQEVFNVLLSSIHH